VARSQEGIVSDDREDAPWPPKGWGWDDRERAGREPDAGPGGEMPDRPELHLVPRDTSFEHQLDETAPKPEPVHEGDGIEIPKLGGDRLPWVPEHLRTWKGIRSTAYKYFDAARFHSVFHAIRSPKYLIMSVLYAVKGLGRLVRKQLAWWWVIEQSHLRTKAVLDGNSAEWRALSTHVVKRRSFRGSCLGAELFAVTLTLVLVAALAPWWAWIVVAAVAMPPLAHYGRPAHKPIVQSAVTTPLVRKISTDAIIRAYESAGLCSTDPRKPADHLGFGSTMSRDALDKGSQVDVIQPYGGTFAAVVTARPKIASGLDVSESQVYFTKDKKSERRHKLLVLDADPLAEPAGRTPLLDLKQRSVWRKAPFGLDQFGRKVAFCLLWISLLIGAQPRRGKTFSGRLLALYCALDPWVDITVIDAKNSPDWLPFQYVAHRFIQGTHPTKDGDPVQRALDALYEIDRHIEHVNEELKKLSVTECPHGKLTEQLYRRPGLHVRLLIMEEFQCFFELNDQKLNKEFANLLARIGAMGPSAGVIPVSLSQKPSGVGAGDVQRLFNRYRDNHTIRFGLRCANRDVSNAILGNEAYGEGYDCSGLPLGEEYKGVGILYGLTDEAPTVRTYLADGEDAEVICLAARKIRERAKTLSGDALGVEPDEPESDIVADLLAVIGGDPGLWWEAAAERLAGQFPMRHADATAESVSAACRGRGVPSVDVKVGGRVLKGCRKAALEHVPRPR
jgi:DNA segregation ATPase FtsK/SpoIIIE, S-DNA-T family